VLALCGTYSPKSKRELPQQSAAVEPEIGFVYLLKSGRFYKIGRSNSAGRRERELALQLPEKAASIHVISTDDPIGIEAYWHKRFEAKRKNGEWFELDAADVRVIKKRKFM
jgi:Meiotically up-regulated gene 113